MRSELLVLHANVLVVGKYIPLPVAVPPVGINLVAVAVLAAVKVPDKLKFVFELLFNT